MKRRRRARFSVARLAKDEGYALGRLSNMTFEIMGIGMQAMHSALQHGDLPVCLHQLVLHVMDAAAQAGTELEKLYDDEYQLPGE